MQAERIVHESMHLGVTTFGNTKSRHLPLVFVHGWGNDSRCWSPLTDVLADDFFILLIDLPGFGLNAHVECDDLDLLYSGIEHVLPPNAHLIGWSLGGMIAMQLAEKFADRFTSVTTIASNGKFVADSQWPHAYDAETFKNFVTGFQKDPENILQRFAFLLAQGDKQRKKLMKGFAAERADDRNRNNSTWLTALRWLGSLDNTQVYRSMSLPQLALFGENDVLVPAEVSAVLVDDKLVERSVVFRGAGHAPHQSQPHNVAREIKHFVSTVENPYQCDKKQVAKSFSSAAQKYEKVAVMQAKVAKQLLALHQDYSGEVCDVGCGTGFCIDGIREHNAHVIGLDIAQGMLQFCQQKYQEHPLNLICADYENLPLKENSLNGIVSSLSMQWSEDLSRLFHQMHQALDDDGWLLFSTLGPNTLHELRNAWQSVDRFVHVNQFVKQADIYDTLVSAGFTVEHQVCQNEVLRYETAIDLMRDLKAIGAHNVNAGKKSGLSTRKDLQRMADAYESFRENGKLPATYEVLYFRVRKARG